MSMASRKLVLSPFLGWCLRAHTSVIWNASSRMFFTGIQYDPVLSKATVVHPCSTNHAFKSSKAGTVVPLARVLISASLSAGPNATATASPRLPTSIAAHRSLITGIAIILVLSTQTSSRRLLSTLCLTGSKHHSWVHVRRPDQFEPRGFPTRKRLGHRFVCALPRYRYAP